MPGASRAGDARRNGVPYTNVYRAGSEQRILVVPGESEINEQMNAALNAILSQAATDAALESALTGH